MAQMWCLISANICCLYIQLKGLCLSTCWRLLMSDMDCWALNQSFVLRPNHPVVWHCKIFITCRQQRRLWEKPTSHCLVSLNINNGEMNHWRFFKNVVLVPLWHLWPKNSRTRKTSLLRCATAMNKVWVSCFACSTAHPDLLSMGGLQRRRKTMLHHFSETTVINHTSTRGPCQVKPNIASVVLGDWTNTVAVFLVQQGFENLMPTLFVGDVFLHKVGHHPVTGILWNCSEVKLN